MSSSGMAVNERHGAVANATDRDQGSLGLTSAGRAFELSRRRDGRSRVRGSEPCILRCMG